VNANWSKQRRQLLGMLGGGAVLAAGCAANPSGAATPRTEEALNLKDLDLEDVGSRIRAFVKASAQLNEGRTIWSTRAEVYAMLPTNEVVPLLRVKGCEQQWIRPVSDTEFVSFDNLLTYYSDFDSDQVIHEFKNPFTGSQNTVKPYVSRMNEGREISPRGVVFRVMREAFPEFYADLKFDVLARRVGESVSFQGEYKWPAEFIRAPAGSKLTTFARASELADPNLNSVAANFAGYVLMPFFPWMEMADHPGHLLWHVQGYKIESLNDLDEDYLAAANADFGDKFEQSPELDDEPSAFARRLRAMGRLP
jgi:hypothetical protein